MLCMFGDADLDLENDAAAANQNAPAASNGAISQAPQKPLAAIMAPVQNAHCSAARHSAHPPQDMPMALDTGHPSEHVQQQQQQQADESKPGHSGHQLAAQQHMKAPANWQRPSDTIIPRASIFYCSSFCSEPGLPKHSKRRGLCGDIPTRYEAGPHICCV